MILLLHVWLVITLFSRWTLLEIIVFVNITFTSILQLNHVLIALSDCTAMLLQENALPVMLLAWLAWQRVLFVLLVRLTDLNTEVPVWQRVLLQHILIPINCVRLVLLYVEIVFRLLIVKLVLLESFYLIHIVMMCANLVFWFLD